MVLYYLLKLLLQLRSIRLRLEKTELSLIWSIYVDGEEKLVSKYLL